ncbi:hypothetical protein AAMO2058_000395900 [Amorphochlora amoebiformis]
MATEPAQGTIEEPPPTPLEPLNTQNNLLTSAKPVVPRIFVSIPSYRDPECLPTILDMYDKAAFPSRVFAGVCWQLHADQDKGPCFSSAHIPSSIAPNIRTVVMDHTSARGPCYARAKTQELWRGEEFYLQIDSHMRFEKAWDKSLIEILSACPSAKPILTTYPGDYPVSTDAKTHCTPVVSILCAKGFAKDGQLRLTAKALSSSPSKPVVSRFWAAGFAFSRSGVLKTTPYDPYLVDIFFGEEASMSSRLWTAGWDFFCPPVPLVYHKWSRAGRPTFRELKRDPDVKRQSCKRVEHVLRTNCYPNLYLIGDYDLGTSRTMQQFSHFTGVDFNKQTISESAKRGGVSPGGLSEDQLNALLSLAFKGKP